MKSINAILKKLTFEDLHGWVGETILNRGRSYVKRVDRLYRTEDNTLASWVTGRKRYATSARVDDAGNLEYFCSCPYSRGPCKHAVAVILAAVEQVKKKETIPLLPENSDLRDALYGEEEDEWPDDEWEYERSADNTTPRHTRAQAKIGKILEKKSREELLDLLIDLSGRSQGVRRHIVEKEQLARGQVGKLVRKLEAEIRDLTAEPAWYNHWSGRGSLPDFSHVEEQLQSLANQGHADAVLQLGEVLWARGNTQVGHSDDDGETAMAIASCLEIVLAALPQSRLPPPEQLRWVINRVLEDEYALLDSAEKLLKRRTYSRAHWREVSGMLEQQLKAMPKPRTRSFSNRYRREGLLNQLLDAYGRAGWKERVIPLLEEEADACQCYPRLAEALLAAGEREEARRWCIRGYKSTFGDSPGIASTLQARLRTMAKEERRHDLVAAYRAQDFFDRPSVTTYKGLRTAAAKAKCWPAVRDAALHYLETGQQPGPGGPKREKNGWPLPVPEVGPPTTGKKRVHRRFPYTETLIDVAIMEKRLDDVVDLYRHLRKTRRSDREMDATVAQAVADTHPDLALTIWKEIATNLIGEVNPKAYETAAVYLRFMKKVYAKNHRMEDWRGLLEGLRREHKAKRRLMGVLDILENKRLVD